MATVEMFHKKEKYAKKISGNTFPLKCHYWRSKCHEVFAMFLCSPCLSLCQRENWSSEKSHFSKQNCQCRTSFPFCMSLEMLLDHPTNNGLIISGDFCLLFFSDTGYWQGRMEVWLRGAPRTWAPFCALLSWAVACDLQACRYSLIRNIKLSQKPSFTDFSLTPVARTGS